MPTYKNDKLNKVHFNSQSATTGEITSSNISSESEINITQPTDETDPDDAAYFTVTRMEGTLVLDDYDLFFTDTMNSGNTIETAMANNTKVYVQIDSEDGTWQDSGGSSWFQVRVMTNPQNDIGSDSSLFKPTFEFTHSDHGGVQRPV